MNAEHFEEDAVFNDLPNYEMEDQEMDFSNTIPFDHDMLSNDISSNAFLEMPVSLLWNMDIQQDESPSESISILSGERSAMKFLCDLDSDKDEKIDMTDWMNKPKEEWEKTDTINWIIWVSTIIGHSYGEMSPDLALPGKDLLSLSRQQFVLLDSGFGDKLYDLLHDKRQDSIEFRFPLDTFASSFEGETSTGLNSDSSGEPSGVDPGPTNNPKSKRPQFWKFIIRLLLNPEKYSALIRWEDRENYSFRFVRNNDVANLWGSMKNRTKTSYDYFTRALRYYYGNKKKGEGKGDGIFATVDKRNVYRFGTKGKKLVNSIICSRKNIRWGS